MNIEAQSSLPEIELRKIYYKAYQEDRHSEGVAPIETGLQAVANAAHVNAWNEALLTIKKAVLEHDKHFQSDEFGRLMKVLDVIDVCSELSIS